MPCWRSDSLAGTVAQELRHLCQRGEGANLGSIFASLSWPGINRTVV